jgi:hypothetical protein
VAEFPFNFFDELSTSGTDEEAAEALLHGAVRFGDTIRRAHASGIATDVQRFA